MSFAIDVVRSRPMPTDVMSAKAGHPVPRVVAVRNTYMGDYWIVRLRGW